MNILLNFMKSLLPERKLEYKIIISKVDAKEAEYYAEILYPINDNEQEMIMKVKLKPSTVKKGLVFFSRAGLMYKITSVSINKAMIRAERVFVE